MRFQGLRIALAVGAAVAFVFALIGCGGGTSESVTETVPPMTKAKLAEKLGEICQEHTDRQVVAIEKFDKEHGWPYGSTHEKASDAQLEKELVVVILPIVRDNIRDLERELRPSRSQKAKLEAFIEALEHGIEFSEGDPSWVTGSTSTEPFMRARYLSVALGTPLCGQA
jgi:hypothetical protein